MSSEVNKGKPRYWTTGVLLFAVALWVTLSIGTIPITSIFADDNAANLETPSTGVPPQSVAKQTTVKETVSTEPDSKGTKTDSNKDSPSEKPSISEDHPLYLPLVEAYKARLALKDVKSYEAVFVKRELIRSKLQKTSMNLKLREDPFSFYLKFLDQNAGREVIYVEGQNKNQLVIHEAGLKSLAGTVFRTPNAPDVMAENRYPADMVGLKKMINKVISQWEEEGKYAEVKTQKRPNSKLATGEECVVYESIHLTPRKQFKFHITRLWIEEKSGLAIRVDQLGFPQNGQKEPPILEEYTYGKLKLDSNLTNRDFDPKNPSYQYQ